MNDLKEKICRVECGCYEIIDNFSKIETLWVYNCIWRDLIWFFFRMFVF